MMSMRELSMKERLFHAITFEVTALALIIPISALLTGQGTGDLAMIGIGLSLFAVAWNYLYNVLFDRVFGTNRLARTVSLRLLHTTGFEGGLVFISIPVIAWVLDISMWDALILEAGFLTFFFIYTTLFNWGYDRIQPYQRWIERMAK
ncbi:MULTISPECIES: PACE efflux transporter [unclassified Vibrio]|uniref:PACE efflux transporter n=1 Tax=unclassified Vibrio TaxID=2614977 RepID=UPI000B8ECB3A|nr:MULTISPECIES: PACE efflux transporter [unclassified Vibrio]NAW97898.1 PACE efflux transporter [Vibrio sp. V23_P3S9T160]OXX46308.1 hypothetical protein B9J85_05670 [Vibrio sp. V11_P1A41T118]